MKMFSKFIKINILFIGILIMGTVSKTVAQSAEIIVPSTICSGPFYACEGSSFTLAVNITGLQPPYKYLWTGGATTSSVTVTSDTLIKVRVRGINSLGVQQTVFSPWRTFKFVTTPAATIVIPGSASLCTGQSTDLVANGGLSHSSYLWSNGATTKTITVNQSGNYSVTITNPSTCSSSSVPRQVIVYDSTFVPNFSANGPLTFCKPGSVTFTADPGFTSYLWSTGETTQSITVNLTGSGGFGLDTATVRLTVEVNNNCFFTSAPKIVRSVREPKLMTPYCPAPALALNRDSIRSEIILPYNSGEVWDYEFEFTEISNQANVINYIASRTRWCKLSNVTPALEVGKSYDVRVRGMLNGVGFCFGTACQITILSSGSRFGNIENSYRENGKHSEFNIHYDRINSGFTANLSIQGTKPVDLKIFDVTGSMVASYSIISSQDQFHFGNDLRPGIYFAEFSQEFTPRWVERIIKTK